MNNKKINIGVLGFGTVGKGVVKILLENRENMRKKTGLDLNLCKIADLDIVSDRGITLPKGVLVDDANLVVNDPEIDVIVELIGGENPAKKFIELALKQSKHVVTSNKEVIAKHGLGFLELAKKNNVNIFYEASAGGGIPIIHALRKSLAANNIQKMYGIMNGTTNYILTKMQQEDANFADVLKQAQELGYAEADPTNDVEGFDVAYKLSILAFHAFNAHFDYKKIFREGITGVSSADIDIAKQFGYVIKLLGIAKSYDQKKIELRVHPVMIPKDHPLAAVNDSFNAVFVEGDYVNETMFYGRGAGELPTASAVVADIIEVGMHKDVGICGILRDNLQ